MRSILVAALVSLLVSILCTPIAIRVFRREGFGQAIRDDGPQSHMAKRGTPTMGGTVIIVATLIGYFVAHLLSSGSGPSATGLLLLYLFTGMGIVGFLDDFIKIR
ncbi:MAG TPA: phospho-N-acetylmuramoyl-pentapeptide-transferase, partial [Mycobacteriales bacterium]|nr:phospho-N-acetylmuramoyl-pentapeptide-transferase [Mycobacteriales bacterium]